MTRQLQVEGFRASGTVVTGRAADGIVSALNESDLLVMSSHGRTGIKRLFLGSVAERVLKKSSNSVFIVRS
jgi:nucleotide-binding universal stress UspA family protein